MTFDSIDWHLEAERIARAFGVESRCEFHPIDAWMNLQAGPARGSQADWTPVRLPSGHLLGLEWSAEPLSAGRFFNISMNTDDVGEDLSISIGITDGGDLDFLPYRFSQPAPLPATIQQLTLELAEGFFNLGLLTPDLEAALRLNISAHQKVEWALEYAARCSNRGKDTDD